MSPAVLLVLLGVSLAAADNKFFGCTMQHVIGVTGANATGGGYVACASGVDDYASPTLACSFVYWNLTTDMQFAHLHVGADQPATGSPTFLFSADQPGSKDFGTVYNKFATTGPSLPYWTPIAPITTYAAQLDACAAGGACYFNLHTVLFPQGELRCEVAPLTTTFSFETVPLAPTPAPVATGNNASIGVASVWMAKLGNYRAWAYQVGFTGLTSPVSASHIHQSNPAGTANTDTGSPIIYLDYGVGQIRTTGKYFGVAVEQDTNVVSGIPVYPSNFDSAIAAHTCYLNVHTSLNGGGEIRGQVAPLGSSASHATVALMAVVFMIASWMSL